MLDAYDCNLRLPVEESNRIEDDDGEYIRFTCVIETAARYYGTCNESLRTWTGKDVPWYGNILVVSHKANGTVLDFKRAWLEYVRDIMTR